LPAYVVAVDAGQTGVRVRIQPQPQDPAQWGVESGPSAAPEQTALTEYPGVRTTEPLSTQLAERIRAAATSADVDLSETEVSIGTSGVADSPALASALRQDLGAPGTGPTALHVAHDSITSYVGALGDHQGVVVAAGTGSIILGVGARDTARVDGWGYLIGDDGSGFSIGARGWRAVMRDHDGRGPATALTEDFRRDIEDLESAYVVLQSDPDRVRRIASYSRRVTALAATDSVARGIAEWAGAELAHSVLTAAHQVGLHGTVTVARLGRVLTDPTVSAAFQSAVEAGLPGAVVVDPNGSGLDGAALLGRVAEGSALAGDIAHA